MNSSTTVKPFNHSTVKRVMAFTLAETLIVIGVIGIVSALTLPNLNSSTGDKEKVAKVKKIYQNLNDAFGRAEAVYGPYEEWFVTDANEKDKIKRAGERITEFMKVSKTCYGASSTGCFTSGNPHTLSGENFFNIDGGDFYKVITADGSSIAWINSSGMIWVDIDGPTKGKYTAGQDLFVFTYDADSKAIVPNGSMKNSYCDFRCLIEELAVMAKGEPAASWIIRYDNADYLKLDRAGKCKNGNQITESNPTCK